MKILIVLAMIISSTAWAEEVQRYEGMQSTKKDGVIVIEISPTANREKLRRQAEIDGQKGRIKAKRAVQENLMREREREAAAAQRRVMEHYRPQQNRSYPSSADKQESSAEWKKSRLERQKRLIEDTERNHVGGLSRGERDVYEQAGKGIDRITKDIEKHPGDY